MADDGFDGRASPQFALDGVGDAAPLAGDIDLKLHRRRRVVAAIASVGDDADKRRADLRLDLGQDSRQRVTVIRVDRHGLHVRDELSALRALQGRGERDLDAELVRPMRLAPRVKPEGRLLPMHSTSGACSE